MTRNTNKLTTKTLCLGLLASVLLLALALPLAEGNTPPGIDSGTYGYAWSGGYAWSDFSFGCDAYSCDVDVIMPAGK
jgi:hypothetical protein